MGGKARFHEGDMHPRNFPWCSNICGGATSHSSLSDVFLPASLAKGLGKTYHMRCTFALRLMRRPKKPSPPFSSSMRKTPALPPSLSTSGCRQTSTYNTDRLSVFLSSIASMTWAYVAIQHLKTDLFGFSKVLQPTATKSLIPTPSSSHTHHRGSYPYTCL